MPNILKEKSFVFAINIIGLYKTLSGEKKEFVMSKQLLRSGTAIGALVRESHNAESKPDFIHKPGIAQKECDESLYWLELLNVSGYISEQEFEHLHKQGDEILRLIKSSILTAKSRLPKIIHHS